MSNKNDNNLETIINILLQQQESEKEILKLEEAASFLESLSEHSNHAPLDANTILELRKMLDEVKKQNEEALESRDRMSALFAAVDAGEVELEDDAKELYEEKKKCFQTMAAEQEKMNRVIEEMEIIINSL